MRFRARMSICPLFLRGVLGNLFYSIRRLQDNAIFQPNANASELNLWLVPAYSVHLWDQRAINNFWWSVLEPRRYEINAVWGSPQPHFVIILWFQNSDGLLRPFSKKWNSTFRRIICNVFVVKESHLICDGSFDCGMFFVSSIANCMWNFGHVVCKYCKYHVFISYYIHLIIYSYKYSPI